MNDNNVVDMNAFREEHGPVEAHLSLPCEWDDQSLILLIPVEIVEGWVDGIEPMDPSVCRMLMQHMLDSYERVYV